MDSRNGRETTRPGTLLDRGSPKDSRRRRRDKGKKPLVSKSRRLLSGHVTGDD